MEQEVEREFSNVHRRIDGVEASQRATNNSFKERFVNLMKEIRSLTEAHKDLACEYRRQNYALWTMVLGNIALIGGLIYALASK